MTHAAQPTVYTKRYSAFRGVDFSTDVSQVDDSRSPWAVNIIADAGGCPQKRPGWRMLTQVEAPVRGIHRFEATVKSKEDENGQRTEATVSEFIVHAGSKLYRWQGGEDAPTEILSELSGDTSSGFMYNDCLYILTGNEYVYVKATLAVGATEPTIKAGNMADGDADAVYIPITQHDMKSSGWKSKTSVALTGEAYEAANMVTCVRKNHVIFDCTNGDGEGNSSNGAVIGLDAKIPEGTHLREITIETEQGTKFTCNTGHRTLVNGSIYKYDDVPIVHYAWCDNSNSSVTGGWHTLEDTVYKDSNASETDDGRSVLMIDLEAFYEVMEYNDDSSQFFTVTYPAEIPKVELPNGKTKEYTDYFDRIRKCRIFNWYNSRMFIAGNPDYPNADWYSEVADPTYFKEINYTEIGNDDSKILGYLPVGEQQAVIKSDSAQLQDASVYLRHAEWDETDGYYFPLRRGVIGIGALGQNGFANLVDDNMYLSADGVMGIICENISGERIIHSRSTRINSKLLKEPDLNRAVCCTWNGYMLIAINGNVYVADSRQKSYARNVAGNFEYEWYYWQDLPAVCFFINGDELFFGTADGKICRLNTDLEGPNRYSDWPDGLSGEPVGIDAVWATKFDDDGDFMIKKNMRRRGCGIFLKGAKNGTVKIRVRLDDEYMRDLTERAHGVYDIGKSEFYDLESDKLPPGPAAVNKKVKKYSVIQVVCSSSEPGDEFGVLAIERRFVKGRFIK